MGEAVKGKTVVVTGGVRGIGRAVSLAFAQEGANIVLNYSSSEPDELAEQIRQIGVKCVPVKADVSKFEEAEHLIKQAKEQLGSVDILINNAGITKDNLLIRMSEESFDEVIAVNLKGAFNTIRHAAPIMIKQRAGAIINMSSVVGVGGNFGQANYSASKAGLIGLTKSIAKELAGRGITCNAIAPGFIETDMTKVLPENVANKILADIPLGRLGKPEEVAELALFLAGSSFITGQVIQIDGGMLM